MAKLNLFQVATMGLGPGRTILGDCSFGFLGVQVDITVRPLPPETFGGSREMPYVYRPKYEITIKIKYKDKEWEETRVVTEDTALSLESIVVWFKAFRIRDVGVKIKNIMINRITPIVNVFKRNKDEE